MNKNTYTVIDIRMFDEWKHTQGWLIDNEVQGLMRYSKKGESSITFQQLFEKYLLTINILQLYGK